MANGGGIMKVSTAAKSGSSACPFQSGLASSDTVRLDILMPKLKKPKLCAIDRQLVSDGWLSPDSYDTNFADVDNTPGIYVFLAIDFNDVSANFVAYVGMSTALKTRWQSHAVLKEIRKNGFWVKRFFKPTDIDDLRSAETAHIQKFNPPWNLIGKTRGVVRS